MYASVGDESYEGGSASEDSASGKWSGGKVSRKDGSDSAGGSWNAYNAAERAAGSVVV